MDTQLPDLDPGTFPQALQALEQQLAALTLAPDARQALFKTLEKLSRVYQVQAAQAGRYRSLFELEPHAYLVTDGEGVVLEANRAAARRLGLPQAALAGKPLAEFVDPEMRPVFLMRLARMQAAQPPCQSDVVSVDVTLVPQGGDPFAASLAAERLCDSGGEPIGWGWALHDITMHRLAEEALAAREGQLTLALEAAREGLVDYGLAAGQIYFSPTFYSLLGYSPGDFPASLDSFRNLIHPDDWPVAEKMFGKDLGEPGSTQSFEFRMRAKAGDWRWLVGHGRVIERDAAGQPVRIVGTTRDITDRKEAEKIILEREALYRAMFEKNQAIKLLIDPETGAIVEANPAACDFYGYSADSLLRMRITDITTLAPEQVREVMQLALAERQTYFVFQDRLASGERRDVEVYTGPVELRGRRLLFSIIHDITERRRAEDALRKSEIANRALVEAIPDLLLSLSPEGLIEDYRAPDARLLPPDGEALGRPIRDVFLPDLRVQSLARLVQEGGIQVHEFSREVAGNLSYFEARFVASGESQILCIVRDITTRRQVEAEIRRLNADLEQRVKARTMEYEAAISRLENQITKNLRVELELRASEEKYRTLIEASPESIIVTDLQTSVLMVNSQTLALFGYAAAREMIGQTGLEILAPPERPRASAHLQQVLETGQRQCDEYSAVTKDGRPFEAEFSVSLVRAVNGAPQGFIIVSRDVTERKQMEAEVRRLNEDLERRVQQRTRELEALYNVMSLGSELLDLPTLLKRSLTLVLQTTGFQAGAVHLMEEAERSGRPGQYSDKPAVPLLRLVAWQGLPDSVVTGLQSLPVGGSLMSRIAQRGEAMVSLAAADEAETLPLPSLGDFRSYVGAPMCGRGRRTVGVLSVFSCANLAVSVEEVALVTTIADQMGAIVENARLRRQAEMAAVMEERQRMARELHDSVTQALYSLALIAAAGKNLVQSGNLPRLEAHLETIDETAQQALREMRLLIHALRPLILEQVGLVEAVRQRLGAVEERVGLKPELVVEGNMEMPPALESELYSMAQEALNNTLRHAHASTVTVRLSEVSDDLLLEVSDDGRGFDPQQAAQGAGLGLTSLRERVEKLGGDLTIVSLPGSGSQVRVRVPRPGQSDGTELR